MNKLITVGLVVTTIGVAACANLERSRTLGNPAISGSVLAVQVCSTCHGVDGNSTSPAIPRLAGQQSAYFTNQMKAFRGQDRSDPAGQESMWGISRHLTDEQIADLAAYFAKQTAHSNAATDPQLMEAGKKIFENGIPDQNVIACSACHGANAQGIEAFPRLANQHADYIVKQLNVFQSTQGRPGTPMEMIVHPLTGENKAAVAAYLQNFPN